jgi:hypothetical protein
MCCVSLLEHVKLCCKQLTVSGLLYEMQLPLRCMLIVHSMRMSNQS